MLRHRRNAREEKKLLENLRSTENEKSSAELRWHSKNESRHREVDFQNEKLHTMTKRRETRNAFAWILKWRIIEEREKTFRNIKLKGRPRDESWALNANQDTTEMFKNTLTGAQKKYNLGYIIFGEGNLPLPLRVSLESKESFKLCTGSIVSTN